MYVYVYYTVHVCTYKEVEEIEERKSGEKEGRENRGVDMTKAQDMPV